MRAAAKFSDGCFHSFFLGLCLGPPVLGSRFGPKSGVSHRRILLLPAEVLQADLRRTSMSVSVNTCFFSLCVPLCFLYSRGPFLAAMFLLVFLDPVLGAMMKQVCWHSRRSKAYRGLPEARMAGATVEETAFEDVNMWQAPVSQKPDLWEPSMWQGQVWEARPDGESTRGKAKFGMRHGSREWEEENSATRRRHQGKGRKRQKTPSPPYNVPHTPLGIRRAGCFLLLCISQTPKLHPRPFFWWFLASAVVLRKASPASAGASAGIRACVGRYVNQNGWFSGPCLATLLPRLIEIARACNHSP